MHFALAYVRRVCITTVRTKSRTFEIIEVLVVGLATEDGVDVTKPALYFALIEIKERLHFDQ